MVPVRVLAHALIVTWLSLAAGPSQSGLVAERAYSLPGGSVYLRVEPPAPLAEIETIALLDPLSGRQAATAPAPVGNTCADLCALFPSLRDAPPARAVLVQGFRGPAPVGTPLVLTPLWTPTRYTNAMQAAILDAARRRDTARMSQLLALRGPTLDNLVRRPAPVSAEPPAFGGYRVLPDRRVRIETPLGEIELALRHDEAPNTCAAFLRLVEGGYYDGSTVARVASKGRSGAPALIQLGARSPATDSLTPQASGPSEIISFELSALTQTFGTVSMARRDDEPDSATGELVICLSDEVGGSLQGRLCAFAVVTAGAQTLAAIQSVPVGPRDPADPRSPQDRPLADVPIIRAWSIPAPPVTGPVPAATPADAPPVDR